MPEPTKKIEVGSYCFVKEAVNGDVLVRKPQHCDITTARWRPAGSSDYIVHAWS